MASTSDLTGRTAIVTGASRGIGYAVAHRLVDAGARVGMVARGEAELGEAAERIGGFALAGDVAQVQAVRRLVRSFRSVLDSDAPDFLINAAGTFSLAPIAETAPEDFDRHLAVNLRGPFLLMRAFLPAMLARGSGHIVSLGSIAGRNAFPANGAYSASKFGVRGLHAVLDQELKGSGVRSTLIEPAATDTPLWDAVDREKNPGLPPAEMMLNADAVADAVFFAITRPAATGIHNIILERA